MLKIVAVHLKKMFLLIIWEYILIDSDICISFLVNFFSKTKFRSNLCCSLRSLDFNKFKNMLKITKNYSTLIGIFSFF